MLITGALVGLLGVPAGLYGNELSLRLGLRTTALGVFLASVMVNALFVFAGDAAIRFGRRTGADCGLYRAGQFLQSDLGPADNC